MSDRDNPDSLYRLIGRNGDVLTVDTYVDGCTLTIREPERGEIVSVELTNDQIAQLRAVLYRGTDEQ